MNKGITKQFALVKQTLLCDLRSVGLGLLQLAFAAVLFLSFFIFQQEFKYGRQSSGLQLFSNISLTNLSFTFFATMCLFLTILREEKEEDTLGLILMTGISPFAYVIAKYGSRFVTYLKLVSIQIPFIVLSIVFGGLTIKAVLMSYLLIFSYTFFLTALSLVVSVISTSLFLGSVIVVLLTSAVHLVGIYIKSGYQSFSLMSILFYPLKLMDKLIRGLGIGVATEELYIFSCLCIVVGVILYISGISLFNTFSTNSFKEYEVFDIKKKLLKLSLLKFLKRIFNRRFSQRAILEKDFRFNHYGPTLWLTQFIVFGLGYLWSINSSYSRLLSDMVLVSSFTSLGLFILLGNFVFGSEMKNQTLQSLLILPNDHKRLFWSKMFALLLAGAPSFSFLIVMGFLESNMNIKNLFITFGIVAINLIIALIILKRSDKSFLVKLGIITLYFSIVVTAFLGAQSTRYIKDILWVFIISIEGLLVLILSSLYLQKYRFFMSTLAAFGFVFIHIFIFIFLDEVFRVSSRFIVPTLISSSAVSIAILYDRILYSMKRVGEKS
ncbi:MAG: hypothetical protein NE334_10270 [Lentisphaeraceae bacterium]|nr:hypothetical protein [Lentisphaeraceae bacterium]